LSRVLLRTVESGAWRVMRKIETLASAHEKTRIFGAHKCHPVVLLYGISHWSKTVILASTFVSGHPVMVLYGISFLPDPKPQTRSRLVSQSRGPHPRTWTRSVGTKNLGATRRNRSLAFALQGRVHDLGRRTDLPLFMLFSEDGGER